MGRRKGRRIISPKKRRLVPDEVAKMGPIRLARFGKDLHTTTSWAQGEHERFIADRAAALPLVVEEVNEAVHRAAEIARKIEPLLLLHRAWWEFAAAHIRVTAEDEMGHDQVMATRMVDYLQSLIAGVPNHTGSLPLSDEIWEELREAISTIFTVVNSSYVISEHASRVLGGEQVDHRAEGLREIARITWCNIRGRQYPYHQVRALRDLIEPHDAQIVAVWGIPAEQLCNGLASVWTSLTLGLGNELSRLDIYRQKYGALVADGVTVDEDTDPELYQYATALRDLFAGYRLFDVQGLAELPDELLKQLSWLPGEDVEFFAEGDFAGWPFRVWPIFKRPFLCVEGRYYCFDSSSLFDRIYRVLERIVFASGAKNKQAWIDVRAQVTEELPFRYLHRLLPAASVHRSVYYPTGKGERNFAELDGLLAWDDHLFLVEVKSGSFTPTSPYLDPHGFSESLKALVGKPAEQGVRFLSYLRKQADSPLLDSSHRQIGMLRLADYRHVSILAVSLDSFTEIAAQASRTSALGVSLGVDPVWSLSIDDLRVYAEVFRTPVEFLHFVEQRSQASQCPSLELNDELDHLGLYLEFNHYSTHATQIASGGARLAFTGYRHNVDTYFNSLLWDENAENPLRQKMPDRLRELIEEVSPHPLPGVARMIGVLLDLSGEARDQMFDYVEGALVDWSRARPFSVGGECSITLCVWKGDWSSSDLRQALLIARANSLIGNSRGRLSLCLRYSPESKLVEALWSFVDDSPEVLSQDRDTAELAANLVARRTTQARSAGKIGRNDLCPCGSGEKYKRCCVVRF